MGWCIIEYKILRTIEDTDADWKSPRDKNLGLMKNTGQMGYRSQNYSKLGNFMKYWCLANEIRSLRLSQAIFRRGTVWRKVCGIFKSRELVVFIRSVMRAMLSCVWFHH